MRISVNQYAQALIEIAAAASERERSALADRFITLLNKNRASHLLPLIIQKMSELEASEKGLVRIDVESTASITDAQKAALAAVFGVALKSVSWQEHDNPSLLSGVACRTGSKVLDVSLNERLRILESAVGV